MNKDLLVLHWKGEDATLLHQREWLATNGLGGFASGTVLGVNSRRYHGLFVPNLAEPKGRYIMISRFDEELICGEVRTQLGGAQYTDGRLLTKAQHYLESFSVDHLMPVWTYRIGDCRLEKTLVLPHGQNTVVVQYRLLEGGPATLHLRPFLAFRRQDAVLRRHEGWPFTLSITGNRHEVSLLDSPLRMRFGIRPEQGAFVAHPHKEENIMYQVERDRGYDHSENAFSPGYFSVAMSVGQPVSFVATTQGWEALETDGISAITAERERIEKLMSIVPEKASKGFAQKLAMAADQFLILPGSRLEETSRAAASGNEVRTIIAGYHWFGDWGRDTMISLDGLTLCTGRFREAGAILRTFSRYVRDGLLPNLFPEGEREALYHTVDATLWYFHAIDRYVNVVGDEEILNELWPVLSGIIEHHLRGTHYGIGVDPEDGLVRAGAPGYQLTWMDAKVGDWVVTPRRGKPVEIQALWHNALNLMVDWGTRLGHDVEAYKAHAIRARNSFNRRFWNESGRYLNDVIDTEGGGIDTSFRPNQLFSVALRYPILDQARWKLVIDAVQSKLLTPYGLRTLSADHPDYKRNYQGDLRARDAAYHQGTVWPWLIGHFIEAWLRVYAEPVEARKMLTAFPEHLSEFGFGSIAEIFDAEPPYAPRGCIAQAWSVAEVLRAWLLTEH